MSRKRMVTRTVKETVYTVKAINTETEKIDTLSFSISSALDEKRKVKTLHQLATAKNYVIMKVLFTTECQTLYGMPEEDFIALAKVLPPRSGETDDGEEVETDD